MHETGTDGHYACNGRQPVPRLFGTEARCATIRDDEGHSTTFAVRISAVVPTRNRPDSLLTTIRALRNQSFELEEIIIVDSSDEAMTADRMATGEMPPIHYITSEPSVCLQRNIGIAAASGDYVFLCDDDIVPPRDYVEVLVRCIEQSGATAVSGLLLQQNEDGDWVAEYPVRSFRRLLWCYVFQLSLWGNLDEISVNAITRPLYRHMKRFYQRRGNSTTLAGWPLLTELDGDVVRTRIYGLGSCIVKKECLEAVPFDEILDAHGIGDNYGVALGLPDGILVVRQTRVKHYVAGQNRLDKDLADFRRALALHYFLTAHARSGTQLMLVWSLFGQWLASLLGRGPAGRAYSKALLLILSGRNPYVVARKHGRRFVEPEL